MLKIITMSANDLLQFHEMNELFYKKKTNIISFNRNKKKKNIIKL